MSVEHGGGSTEEQRTADTLRDTGRHVFAHLYESYAASLFDYCDGLLRDTIAAADAVQDSLVEADAQIGSMPEPDQLRLSLYSAARRQCLAKLTGSRGKLSDHAETATLDELQLAAAVSPFEARGGGERLLVLAAALDRLADRDREVLSLAYRHRFDEDDLATVLGVPVRRARTLLSEAGVRFTESATVVAVLRAAVRQGRPGCQNLASMISRGELASLSLTPQLTKRLARHIESCPNCLRSRGDQELGPERLSEIPLVIPPGRLRLRITRTALALGSYHRPPTPSDSSGHGGSGHGGSGPDHHGPGGPPVPLRPRRGVSRVMALSSVTLLALVVPGALIYRLASTSSTPPPVRHHAAVKVATGFQTPAVTTSSSAISQPPPGSVGLRRHRRHHVVPPLPGALSPDQLGEMPSSLPQSSGSPTPPTLLSSSPGTSPAHSPAPTTTASTTAPPSRSPSPPASKPPPTPSPTTPAPAPTTPAPTPSPSA
jgi:RNA polymerase sigma factor (sigma-70 family)